MKLDLGAVTLAIDRLYLTALQLPSQRFELNVGKGRELDA